MGYKAIEVNPLDLIKAFPPGFWLEVPTWAERYRCAGLQDYKRVPDRSRGRGYQKDKIITPALVKKYPEYAEFYALVVNPSRHESRAYKVGSGRYSNPEGPLHDWVELVIGKARKRYKINADYHDGNWEYAYEGLDGWREWRDLGWQLSTLLKESGLVTTSNQYNQTRKIGDEMRMEKKMASLWNRLRKKHRRELGKELPVEEAVDLAANQRAVRITKAKMAAGAHVAKLIDELIVYKKQIANGNITRERVREIFDMTNHLTSVNKELKDALGVR
jgi:hypothetical protein